VDHERVDGLVAPTLGACLPESRLTREQVVRGQHERAARQQVYVEPLHRQPLEVHHVGGSRGAAVADHVRSVGQQLGDPAAPGSGGPARAAVEQLTNRIALDRGRRVIGELTGDQFHLGASAGQRRA
jgi:hypothetical protein